MFRYLAIVAAISISGCGGGGDNATSGSSGDTANQGLINEDGNNNEIVLSRGYPDEIIDSFDNGNAPFPWPYGQLATNNNEFNIPVPLEIILGPPSEERIGSRLGAEFLSIPAGNYVTVGFVDEVIIDGPGPDLEIVTLIDHAGERANLYIGSSVDSLFSAGTIGEGGTTSIDFQSIGYDGTVSIVRIEGLDNRGSAPGFDLMGLQAVNFQETE